MQQHIYPLPIDQWKAVRTIEFKYLEVPCVLQYYRGAEITKLHQPGIVDKNNNTVKGRWELPKDELDTIMLEWVRNLAATLVDESFDVMFDQYEPLGTEMNHFMQTPVHEADRILLFCTPTFRQRSDNMESSSGFEASLISNSLIKKHNLNLISSDCEDRRSLRKYSGLS